MVDIIIIGGGTAGMTAALYAKRSGKSVLVLEKETVGGQIAFSPRVENYPSRKAITGSDFSDKLFSQITDLGVLFELEEVQAIVKKGNSFVVSTEYAQYEAKSVIIAGGVKHRHFGFPNENELIGNGISYCAICDGAFYADEEVVLIGDGNTALQYSILLSNYCKKVTVVTLFDKFFGDEALVSQLKKRENVQIYHNKELVEMVGEKELSALRFIDKENNNQPFVLTPKACFVAIGQIPENEIYKDLVDLDSEGYIIATEDCKTRTAGLFVAGDCRTKAVRQLTTAVADGAVAAVNAVFYAEKV